MGQGRSSGQLRRGVTKAAMILGAIVSLNSGGCGDSLPMGPAFSESEDQAGFLEPVTGGVEAPFASTDFEVAESCAGCHPQHYAEWRNTAHAHAMQDPVFEALIARQRKTVGTDLDLFCTQCHSTIGTRSGEIEPGFELASLSPVTQQGVTCNACHRVTGIERANNAGHVLDPSAALQGPLRDPARSHSAQYSPVLESAAFCGSCHDVEAGALVLESPYAEWVDSPAAQRGESCQGCHMPTYTGKAAALPGIAEREGLHRHSFTGVEVPLSMPSGAERDDLEKASEAFLRKALQLSVKSAEIIADEGTLRVDVIVQNLSDGHRVPTGSSFFRQCWLAVEVTDAQGVRLFESGQLDARDDLYDELHSEGHIVDRALHRFSATLRDAKGEAVLYPFEAVARDEQSLAPLEKRQVRYDIELGSSVTFPLTVSAQVRFRSLPPRLLRDIGLTALLPRLRVIDMAEAAVQVTPELILLHTEQAAQPQ